VIRLNTHEYNRTTDDRDKEQIVTKGLQSAFVVRVLNEILAEIKEIKGGSDMGMTKWIPGAKMWRETFVAGATNTGNVTATVGNKLVLNWHGTPTQRDGVLQMFPVIRDKLMPGVELGSCADAIIASIHDGGISPDKEKSNIQSLAMLWRVFTTRLDDGTYGDLIAHTNMHAAFELHEQPNDQFKITWKISVLRGRTP
jgi:hypothetical protein